MQWARTKALGSNILCINLRSAPFKLYTPRQVTPLSLSFSICKMGRLECCMPIQWSKEYKAFITQSAEAKTSQVSVDEMKEGAPQGWVGGYQQKGRSKTRRPQS